MQLEIGSVIEGKVTGTAAFGAFVALPGGKSGLVHISEITNGYVKDVNDHLSVGQTVRVKIIGINGEKINLSIKKAEPQSAPQRHSTAAPRTEVRPERDASAGFEDKLKKFMQDSDSRIADNPMYADRGKSRRRR